MDLAHGFGLMFIGIILTVIGFAVALYYGSKSNKPKEELTSVQKSLRDLNRINARDDTE